MTPKNRRGEAGQSNHILIHLQLFYENILRPVSCTCLGLRLLFDCVEVNFLWLLSKNCSVTCKASVRAAEDIRFCVHWIFINSNLFEKLDDILNLTILAMVRHGSRDFAIESAISFISEHSSGKSSCAFIKLPPVPAMHGFLNSLIY